MCGICGFISHDVALIERSVRSMTSAMVLRGPNDVGFEILPLTSRGEPSAAGFGFRRLSILDLSPAGHQPMKHPESDDCLIFNGEIYNFYELRKELQAEGLVFRGVSDTEVLLHALSCWGEAAVAKLHGMYSFAFYKAASRRILLARDPLGIKPLYVSQLPRGLAFASEIRALLASGVVPRDLDLDAITGMLAFGSVQSPRTVYTAIRDFPAGAMQWIDGDVASGTAPHPSRSFWAFPNRFIDEVPEVAAKRVRTLVTDSVRRHLVADVPVGVFLSAGIDSTIIAACVREFSQRVSGFTVGFEMNHGSDETVAAGETARLLGIKHVSLRLTSANLHSLWHDWQAATDSPSIDGFNTFVVSSQLAREGVVVGLSGLGADEFFGGYSTFDRAPRLSRLLKSIAFVPEFLRATLIRTCGSLVGQPSGYVEKLADLVSSDSSVAGVSRSLRRLIPNRALTTLTHDHFVSSVMTPLHTGRFEHTRRGSGDVFNEVSRIEAIHYMRDTLLRDTDANSMRHSLEVRVPLLDQPLVDYVASLAGRTKRPPHSLPKSLLREGFRDVLPEHVSSRPKSGFTLPIGDWMRHSLRGACEPAIQSLASLPMLDGEEVRRVWAAFQRGEPGIHWSRPLALVVLGQHLMRNKP